MVERLIWLRGGPYQPLHTGHFEFVTPLTVPHLAKVHYLLRCLISCLVSWSTVPDDKILSYLKHHIHVGCVPLLYLCCGNSHKWVFFASPNFKRCPFRCQWSVNNPVTHFIWFLYNSNNSLVLLFAEGPWRKLFAYVCPVMDSQCFLWSLLVQTAFLAATTEMPHASLGPVNERSVLFLTRL